MKKIVISILLLVSLNTYANNGKVYCQSYPSGDVVCTDGVNRWVMRRGV